MIFILMGTEPASADSHLEVHYTQSEYVKTSFESNILQQRVDVKILVPKGYPFEKPTPTVYFLHGRGASHAHLNWIHARAALNKHMKNGGSPFLIVAPTQPIHSYWKNRADGFGNVEDMIVNELLDFIDNKFHTSKKRAIMGLSMGGHGALFLGCKPNSAFTAAYALSPIFYNNENLKDKDRGCFGNTAHQVNYNDPSQYILSQSSCDFFMEMGNNDHIFTNNNFTQFVFQEVLKDKPNRVKFSNSAKHDFAFWRQAMPRALDFFETRIGQDLK